MVSVQEQIKNNQDFILASIICKLRESNEWGNRGLYTKIGKFTGYSPAYTGQVLNKNKPIRFDFLEKISKYLGVSVESLALPMENPADNLKEKIAELLKSEFAKGTTKYLFCRKSRINPTSVDRYLNLETEPTVESLQKLSNYFNVTFSIVISPTPR